MGAFSSIGEAANRSILERNCGAQLGGFESPIAGEIAQFVEAQAPLVADRIEREFVTMRGQSRLEAQMLRFYATHADPLVCRMCVTASLSILNALKANFPEVTWVKVITEREVKTSDLFLHMYIYSPDQNLIVDMTYRQYLSHFSKEEFAQLPKVFVGSPDEFIRFMSGKIPKYSIRNYLNAKPEQESEEP